MPKLTIQPNDPNLVLAEVERHSPTYLEVVSQNIRNLGLQDHLLPVGLYAPHLFQTVNTCHIGREVEDPESFWFIGTNTEQELRRQLKTMDYMGITSQLLPTLNSDSETGMMGIFYNHRMYVRPELEPNLMLLVLSVEGLVCGWIGGLAVIHGPTGLKRKQHEQN